MVHRGRSYQNKPNSFIHLINLDFDKIDDPDDNLIDDIYSTICFQRQYFNDTYFDLGSSSKSLNQFILIDSEPLFDYHMFSDSNLSFPRFICRVLNHISRLLRFAYNKPSPAQLPKNLKFDGIKGTIAYYDTVQIKGKTYYNKIINSGIFAKLPRPTSPEQYRTFYNMPIVDIFTLINHISAHSTTVDTFIFNKALRSYPFLSELSRIQDNPASKAQDVFPLQEKTPGSIPSSIPSISYPLCILPGKHGFSSNNQHWDGEDSSDALVRSRNIIARYFIEYWKEFRNIPTRQECRTYYRKHPSSTGEEDSGDVIRLNAVYDYVNAWFKPEKVGMSQILITRKGIDHDLQLLQTLLTQDLIDLIKISHGNTYKKISIGYLDLAIGQTYFMDKTMRGKDRKELEKRELTVSTGSMSEFTQHLYKNGILKRTETWKDEKKCRAIRYVLEHIGWIECLDKTWNTDVSKRWGIGKAYHRYDEYVGYVGKPTIDRIQAKGLASLQDWDSMGSTA
jgi:hypothetical protein